MTEDGWNVEPVGAVEDTGASDGLRMRRRWTGALLALLTTVVISLAGAFTYANSTAQKWRDRTEVTQSNLRTVQGERDELSKDLGRVRDEADRTKASLADMTERFNEASDRIRSLANEKAQVGDELAHAAQITALSTKVTKELDACVENLQQMQVYLVDFQSYDFDSLLSYVREVNASCNAAQDDNASLARLINGE